MDDLYPDAVSYDVDAARRRLTRTKALDRFA
jgi:hypothetical protein